MHLIDQQLNHMIRGEFEKAWEISEKLEKIDPEDLRHKFNRGWFLLNQGDLQAGFQNLECGRFLNVYGSAPLRTDKPIWNNHDIRGKTVLINLEAGYGDQMISARFAQDVALRGGKCILVSFPEMFSLLERIPGVTKCITNEQVETTPHDYWIPGFSCAWLFGHTFDTLPNNPYIFANPDSTEIWKNIINSKKPRVGIRWSGNPKFEHQQFRIFPAENIINLHEKFPDIQFYSLQRDEDVRELPEGIVDLQHFLISWADTAAAIQNLDLVITSCTSIAHLSAAMGKPTWVIVPILPYHVWAYGGDHSPWYPKTTKVYRQTEFSRWDNTFAKIENDLKEYFISRIEASKINNDVQVE